MKRKKHKQVAAICCIVLLVLVYIIALIAALLDKTSSGQWFQFAMVATLIIPVVTWVYIWLYGALTGKETIADLHLMEDRQNEEQQEENQQEES